MAEVASPIERLQQRAIGLQGINKGRWSISHLNAYQLVFVGRASADHIHGKRYRASRSRFDLDRPETVKINLSRESHASPRSIPLAC